MALCFTYFRDLSLEEQLQKPENVQQGDLKFGFVSEALYPFNSKTVRFFWFVNNASGLQMLCLLDKVMQYFCFKETNRGFDMLISGAK